MVSPLQRRSTTESPTCAIICTYYYVAALPHHSQYVHSTRHTHLLPCPWGMARAVVTIDDGLCQTTRASIPWHMSPSVSRSGFVQSPVPVHLLTSQKVTLQ
jgi:hypothetical protein